MSLVNNNIPPRTVGILGGTFDPIHNGHIEPAISVARALNLDELRLLPAHIPPHKGKPSATAQQRQDMVNLVCQHNPIFSIDNQELKSHKTSYSVHTLQRLKSQSPSTIYLFIMGMDSLQSFTSWHLWEDILQCCHIVVNARPGYSKQAFNVDTVNLLNKHQCHNASRLFDKDSGSIYIHAGIKKDISSSAIREVLGKAQGNTEKSKHFESDLLPDYIQDYIYKNQLYA